MIALLLSFAASPLPHPQDAPPEARLHPQDTILLVELPDIPKVLTAYERAPLVQMIRDEDVRATVADLLDAFELDLTKEVERALLGLGAPPEVAADPGGVALAYLQELEALSFSVSIESERAAALASNGPALVGARTELAEIQAKLDAYREGGGWLTNLDDLGLRGGLASDPWDHAYVLGDDGRVSSLGADGQPGGESFDADIQADFDIAGFFTRELPSVVGVLVHARFTSDEAAARAFGFLGSSTQALGIQPGEAGELDYAGTTARLVPHRLDSVHALTGVPAWTLLSGREMALGVGKADAPGLAMRRASADGTAAGSAAEFFDAVMSRLPPGEGTDLVRVGLASLASLGTLSDLTDKVGEGHGNLQLNLSPSEHPGALRMQLLDDRFVTDMFLGSDQKPEALTSHVACTPVPEDLWSFVPEEAIGVLATTLDGPSIYSRILSEVGTQSQAHAKLIELEQRYGFSLEQDVFASLGDGVAGYMLPIKGVMAMPEIAVAVELSDTEAFQRGLEGILALLAEQAGGEIEINNRPYRKTPLWTFSFPGSQGASGMLAMGFSPSVTIVEDHLILTISSLRAKREIKRLLKDEGGAVDLGDYAPPADAAFYGYMDWAAFINGIYDGLRGMAGLMGAMGGGEALPFDPAMLPDAQTFTRFFRPTVLWGCSVPATEDASGGVALRYESSFGPETWLSLAAAGGAAFLGVRTQMNIPGPEPEFEIEETSDGAAEDAEAQTDATRDTLKYLTTRLAVHKIALERYPAGLVDLTLPTDNYPRGFLDGQELPADAWGRAFSYETTGDGYALWSLGPDGMDQRGGGDDIVGG